MCELPKTQEQYSSHIPALHTLEALGFTCLSPDEYLTRRGITTSVLLKDVMIEMFKERDFDLKGKETPTSCHIHSLLWLAGIKYDLQKGTCFAKLHIITPAAPLLQAY